MPNFETFMKIGHCVFVKIYILDQKNSRRVLFTICCKFCFIRYSKVFSCKDNYMCYLLKKFEHFITSSYP